MLAENIPVPSSPVPIATIDLVQSQSGVGSPATARKTIAVPAKKTKHQEEQEDVSRPAWVLSGAPWVTIAFTIFQIREKINMAKGGGSPPEDQPLQVKEMTRSTRFHPDVMLKQVKVIFYLSIVTLFTNLQVRN